MANNYPYEQWYWEDWFTDTSFLSPMTKYVWFQVLGVMWTKGRLATLTQRDDEFCRFLGIENSVFDEAVTELLRDCYGRVTRSDGFTTFYSKRRDKDNNERNSSKERMKKMRSSSPKNNDVSRDGHANVTGHTRAYIQSHSHSHNQNVNVCENARANDDDSMPLTGGGVVIRQPPKTAKEVMDAAALRKIVMSEESAMEFMDYYSANAWTNKYGRAIPDWTGLIRSWVNNPAHRAAELRLKQQERFNANASRALEPRASVCGDPRNTAADFDDFPC